MGAAPLGANLAVSSFFPLPSGAPRAGVYVINTATWKAQLVDSTTPAWYTNDGVLVTFTQAGQFRLPSSWASKGTGIRIYDSQGNLRHQLEGTQAFTTIETTPLYDLAVLPTVTPPVMIRTPAQHHAYEASVRTEELLFEPATGNTLGIRTVTEPIPELIASTAHTRR
jgi:hypothetical protein